MGLYGIGKGLLIGTVGIIKEDDEMIKKGLKKVVFGTATMMVGDVLGVSDTIDALTSISDDSV